MSEPQSEFQEIGLTGGKLSFYPDGTMRYEHRNPVACSMFELYASRMGEPLAFIPAVGLGQRYPPPPTPDALLMWILSDREGMFGRQCPRCNRYFRSDGGFKVCTCTYCMFSGSGMRFFTENQKRYLEMCCAKALTARALKQELVLDLDDLPQVDGYAQTASRFSEERQQTKSKCQSCRTAVDALGLFHSCPSCGERNTLKVLSKLFEGRMTEIGAVSETPGLHTDEERKLIDALKDIFTQFESAMKDLQGLLLLAKLPPQDLKVLRAISFQRLFEAAEKLQGILSIDILAGVPKEQHEFLKLMVQRRHVFTHNSGIVDEDYLARSGDKSARLGQRLSLRTSEVKVTAQLLSKVADVFFGKVMGDRQALGFQTA